VANEALMQFQADILGVPVIRPVVAETTALGAAYAAGLATEFWKDLDELRSLWQEDTRWDPTMDEETRTHRLAEWRKAVTRTFDWVDPASA
ncbi:FGGY-family carbohydrate kinase, partial [uncultured Schumannella sp.]|uniref:FGGY-family carbohydrate kinase n=1 Tax=uncultured Schumannella sp. TaxID=1195956 RepID=UPI0025D1E5E8